MIDRKTKFVLILTFPFLFFFVLEIVLRLFWNQPSANLSRNIFTEQDGYKVLTSGARGTNYGQEYSVEVVGNEYGYREGTWPKHPTAGKVVWLFGDSFAFGWGVEAHQTFAALLSEQGFAVYDLGIPGDGWEEYLYRLDWAKANLPKPNFIFVATYDNDFLYPPNIIFKNNLSKWIFNIRYALVTSQVGRLIKRICYDLGLSNFLARWLDSDANVRAAYGRDFSVHEKNYLNSEPGQAILAEVDQFLKEAETISGNSFIIRIVPGYCNGLSWQDEAIAKIGKPNEIYDFNRLDEELARICQKHSAHYVRFSAKTDLETQNYYFRYNLYLTPVGHEALADQLVNQFNE